MNVLAASGEIKIQASARQVYELIAQVETSSRWAAECVRNEWLDGATGPRVGARFKGSNRRGLFRWSTVATITDAELGRYFAFDVHSGGTPVSRWEYELVDTPQGCLVIERAWERRPGWMKVVSFLIAGVWDRPARNRNNIEQSQRRLKAVAEGLPH
ncbi:SRPBCC family protein [Nocardia pseudobrasiliensis]|uniref:Polyketide cyclase/dehydrase/lipid transport protein n=1 Tax=Nocardia pseudobrasiliensis TaxID=45979 RepID=A0A370HZX5_9NOCA|nr:SRPBCC family protein [Nocardia pseudobrasiliensis]RDI64056.1 polyketide cyclase/dehydrase/lipid transport protein [Nocardia pseudobrasiliensis]